MPRRRVISYAQAVTAAERQFHRTGRLDMAAVAVSLSVSRATLYRVVGNRDRLLGDVLWQQGSRLLERSAAAARGSGVDRLVDTAERFRRDLAAYRPLQTLLAEDRGTAVRVLLMPEGGVHTRFVAQWRQMLEQAERDGELVLSVDAGDAAVVLVRIGESVLYSRLLGDPAPGDAVASRVQRALLAS